MVKNEECSNCGDPIGKLETPRVWKQNVVCGNCYRRLKADAIPVASPADEITPDVLIGVASEVGATSANAPTYRAPLRPAKYVDPLWFPRLIFLLLAVVLTLIGIFGRWTLFELGWCLIVWAAWFALVVTSIVKKAAWQERTSR